MELQYAASEKHSSSFLKTIMQPLETSFMQADAASRNHSAASRKQSWKFLKAACGMRFYAK
jgi:hypothetical protein